MTVAHYLGIGASFAKGHKAEARELLKAVNEALASRSLPRYVDPKKSQLPPESAPWGRSNCDHSFHSGVEDLGKLGMRLGSSHLRAVYENPCELVFVPIPFPFP